MLIIYLKEGEETGDEKVNPTQLPSIGVLNQKSNVLWFPSNTDFSFFFLVVFLFSLLTILKPRGEGSFYHSRRSKRTLYQCLDSTFVIRQ